MKLIKIDGYWIIVNNEKIQLEDWVYCDIMVKSIIHVKNKRISDNDNSVILLQNENGRSGEVWEEYSKKIIASQNPEHNLPTITFSDDVAKELEIVDIKKLFEMISKFNRYENDLIYNIGNKKESYNIAESIYSDGYNQALSDNKDKLFTLEDMRKSFYQGHKSGLGRNDKLTFNQTIQSITKQEYEVELDMEIEDYSYPIGNETNDGNGVPIYIPKIKNNTIKVINLLK